MALRWEPKSPDEVVRREISWIGQLNGDYIDASALSIEDGFVTIDSDTHDNDKVSIILSGGEAGTVVFRSRVTTGDGRTLEQIIVMDIREVTACTGPAIPSTASKKTIIDMAFETASLSGYTFDMTPEEYFSALRRLDGVMSGWEVQGIRIGYNFPSTFGGGDIDEAAGIPDFAVVPASTSLALSIAPGLAKSMSAEARAQHNSSMITLRTATARIPDRPLPAKTPRGSGQQPWNTWQPFIYPNRSKSC